MILLNKNQQTLTEKIRETVATIICLKIQRFARISFRFQYSALRFFLLGFSHQFKNGRLCHPLIIILKISLKSISVHIKITISQENPRTKSRKIRQERDCLCYTWHIASPHHCVSPGHIHTFPTKLNQFNVTKNREIKGIKHAFGC